MRHGLLLADKLVNQSGHEGPSVPVWMRRDKLSTTTRAEVVVDNRMVVDEMRRRAEVPGTESVVGTVPGGVFP